MELTPLGALLEAGRTARGLSQNAAAREAGASGTAWRRVIEGKARVGGVDVNYPGKATTVAKMAEVARLSPDDVEAAGRKDVADQMRHAAKRAGTGRSPKEFQDRVTRLLDAGMERQLDQLLRVIEEDTDREGTG